MKISIQIDQRLIDLKSEMVSITQNIMVDHVYTVNYQLGLTRRTRNDNIDNLKEAAEIQ